MKIKCNLSIVDGKPYKVDFRQLIRDLAKLSDLMGKQWVDTTTFSKVAQIGLKTANNPIFDVDTDGRMEIIGEHYEIMQQNGGVGLRDYIPQLNELACLICNKIEYGDIDPENPNRKENKND